MIDVANLPPFYKYLMDSFDLPQYLSIKYSLRDAGVAAQKALMVSREAKDLITRSFPAAPEVGACEASCESFVFLSLLKPPLNKNCLLCFL